MNVIPEYVFAHYEGSGVPLEATVDKLREAARAVYRIKDFEIMKRAYIDHDPIAISSVASLGGSRGDFGEVILHMLLRDFKQTIPLVSKVYFKDSTGVPSHGFDLVHVSPREKILWLGESKFYTNPKQVLSSLEGDLRDHFKQDFLDSQFLIIKKNLEAHTLPGRDEWLSIIADCNTLRDRISMISTPLLCIYPNDVYTKYTDMRTPDAANYHEINVRELKSYFDEQHNDHPLKNHLHIVLICFPIREKIELAKRLHEKLWHMQSI